MTAGSALEKFMMPTASTGRRMATVEVPGSELPHIDPP